MKLSKKLLEARLISTKNSIYAHVVVEAKRTLRELDPYPDELQEIAEGIMQLFEDDVRELFKKIKAGEREEWI